MKKFIFIINIIFFITSVDYEKIYSGKNLNLSIKNIKKENNIINNELSNALLGIFSNKTSENIFDLEIEK